MNNRTKYSLELIAQKREEKEAELRQTVEHISELSQKIMNPPQNKSNAELWMHYASNGMAAYNGIMICNKLYQRLRGTFKKKKRKRFFSWF